MKKDKKLPKKEAVEKKNSPFLNKDELEEYSNPVGRPSVMTDERKEAILEALRGGLPARYSAHLVGIHHDTLRKYLERDLDFSARVNIAKAIGIKGFKNLTAEQGGAWKILKNIGKEEFKENIDLSFDESKEIILGGLSKEVKI